MLSQPNLPARSFMILFFCAIHAYSALGQETHIPDLYSRQVIFWEIGGHTRGLLSVNYERLFKGPFRNSLWSLRTGVGISPGESDRDIPSITSVPAVASLMVGRRRHFVVLSVGWTASFSRDKIDSTQKPPMVYQQFEPAYVVTLGYRLMKIDNVMFEAAPTVLWTNNPTRKFQWSFTLIVGFAF